MEKHLPRKLAAILYADVAGYSRLTGDDEEGTHRRLSEHLDLLSNTIGEHQGRVVHYAGDAVLADFRTVTEALTCATSIQQELARRNQDLSDDRKVQFRIGVNLGDVIEDRGDIYGDGVNIAARLESLAPPGGICISGSVYDVVSHSLPFNYEFMGEQKVKNIEKPVRVYRVEAKAARDEPRSGKQAPKLAQEVHFCVSSDGVGIAYSVVGSGPPLVKAANWLNHLEYDWESPIWRHLFRELAREHTLVRYDERGNGLSDWDVEDFSFEAFVRDLEAVVDAAGVERFPLLGVSQGCAVSVAYTVRHPEKVSGLILYGGFARGRNRRGSALEVERGKALLTLMRQGWGQDNPAFRQMFTTLFVPGATREQMDWFNDLQRMTTSAENAVRLREVVDDIDVTDLLDRVKVPTLVLHCRGDAVQPFEEGRRLAAMISGSRFVTLEGENHLFLEDEPAWSRFRDEVRTFLANEILRAD